LVTVWYQGVQNIGLSNHKLKSALQCTVHCDHNVRPSQTDRQTDRWTNIMAKAWHRALKTNIALPIEMQNFKKYKLRPRFFVYCKRWSSYPISLYNKTFKDKFSFQRSSRYAICRIFWRLFRDFCVFG